MTRSATIPEKNPYTQLPGYVWAVTDYPNGWFAVFDRRKLGEQWYTEPGKHRWVVKKMPDGPTKTASTEGDARMLALISAKAIHSYEMWWKQTS